MGPLAARPRHRASSTWPSPNPNTQYETKRVAAWFDHYLRGHKKVSTGPQFSYFRDWVKYSGIATPAYAQRRTFPVARAQRCYLSGDGTLVRSASRGQVRLAELHHPPGRRADHASTRST